jgi:hypothetical protein
LENTGSCVDFPPNVETSLIVKQFPNPFRGTARLNILSKDPVSIRIRAIDMAGRLIADLSSNVFRGNNDIKLPSLGWANGIYTLLIETNQGEKFTLRVVKQD